MKDIIYLVCNNQKVEGMRKTLPDLRKGEICIKLTVEVESKAFGSPTIEKKIYVEDWRHGIDLEDVEFRQNIITEEEAQMIREKRLARMEQILKSQGYTVKKPNEKETEKKHD